MRRDRYELKRPERHRTAVERFRRSPPTSPTQYLAPEHGVFARRSGTVSREPALKKARLPTHGAAGLGPTELDPRLRGADADEVVPLLASRSATRSSAIDKRLAAVEPSGRTSMKAGNATRRLSSVLTPTPFKE